MYLSNCKTNLDALKQVTTQLECEIGLLQSKLDQTIIKPKPYVKYPEANKYNIGAGNIKSHISYMFTIKNGWGSEIEPTLGQLTARRQEIYNLLDRYTEDCKPITEQNTLIAEHNKLVREKVSNFMRELGVRDTYITSEFKTQRSSKRTTETHNAGYLGDLTRLIGYCPNPEVNVDNTKRLVDEYFSKKQKEAVEKQRLVELEQKKKTEMHELALLRAKYTPEDAEPCKYDIRDQIVSKNKYLMLAHYLELNRGDWSDGYDYAERGISNFTIETDEDKRIIEALQQTIEDNEYVDGRVFRDCWPTYGDLYAKVEDVVLLSDLEKIAKHFY